jgi:hypothetical protein
MSILDEFSPTTLQMVTTTFLYGGTVFPDSDDTAVLEQLFCFAVLESVWDELDGVHRSPQAVLAAIAEQLDPGTPDRVRRSFGNLAGADFAKAYGALRQQASVLGVNLQEYCQGLKQSKAIMSAVARIDPSGGKSRPRRGRWLGRER